MKKINAFYCIKTPSDWKESVLMYDKPDDSDCVITYHRFSETEVEVADKGEILDTDSKTE